MFEYVWREGSSHNVTSKFVLKVTSKDSETLEITNRMTLQKAHAYGISVWAHNDTMTFWEFHM